MKRLAKYFIALGLVASLSLTMSVSTQVRREARSQVVFDPALFGMSVTELLESLSRLGEVVSEFDDAKEKLVEIEKLRQVIVEIQNVVAVMQLIGIGIDSFNMVVDLVNQISDDIVLFKEYDQQLSMVGSDMSEAQKTINLASSYMHIANIIIRLTANELKYVVDLIKNKAWNGLNKNDLEKQVSSVSGKEVLMTVRNMIAEAYSSYQMFRYVYLQRYVSYHQRFTRRRITILNDEFLTLVF